MTNVKLDFLILEFHISLTYIKLDLDKIEFKKEVI